VQPITQSSAHAIRALTHLALQDPGEFQLGKDMARELGVPAPFLVKLLQPLVARGLLESQRGRGGGFRLALDPAEITLFRIVDAQEHLSRARQCFLGQTECSDERACPMHEFWKQAAGDLLARLSATTLADIARFCDRRPGSGYPNRAGPPGGRARRGKASSSKRR